MTSPEVVRLRAGGLALDLLPALGGGVTAFRFDGLDVMRPADPAKVAAGDPTGLAAFPLVPYSNRIAHGRFAWDGRTIKLPLNHGDHPHSLHGTGWRSAWTVEQADGASATLAYAHAAADWPWSFRATQTFTLAEDRLDYALSVENRSDTPMPAGLGFHPYFPNTPDLTLAARHDGWWETDAHVMPVRHRPTPPATDLTAWLHAPVTTDNVFSGADGRMRLDWPARRLRLHVEASPALARWMVVYAPAGGTETAIEPVTHPTDALNAPGLPGIRVLAPGETLTLAVRYRVERI